MSVQFGRWNIDGPPVDPGYLQKTKDMLTPYGPDGEGAYIKDSVGILFHAFHTTKESRKESQPLVTPSGSVLCWDGRLDNREELLRELGEPLAGSATDVDIVATAYEAKGTACFAKLMGDWALSVWEPKTRSVVLAKDPIGTRHFYYSFDKDQITWSTILDPLVLLVGKSFALEEEYIAGWLSFFPATHLTPYVGIHSVPPSCFVRLEPGHKTIEKYWNFDSSKRICHRTDSEYEEHFRQVFGESVRRRLRSDSPILSELSGGMDSSSIVCMADAIVARGDAETPRLDTISYLNDSEPNWNERPYFAKVEEKRVRPGHHIDVGSQDKFDADLEDFSFTAAPAGCNPSKKIGRELAKWMASQGHRILLSGIAGDEVTGGVPTPIPELADLLAEARFRALARQLKVWALNQRRPWVHLLFEGIREFLPRTLAGVPKPMQPAPWIDASLIRRQRAALAGYEARTRVFGARPSFQDAMFTLSALRRQIACASLSSESPYETRYPFLDRDFLEFLYAIPRAQLVRPGHRRSLMRRALAGIVPDAILERRRKAYVSRAPVIALKNGWSAFTQITEGMRSGELSLVNPQRFVKAVNEACDGKEAPLIPIMRTLVLELWLRRLGFGHAAESAGPARSTPGYLDGLRSGRGEATSELCLAAKANLATERR